MVQSNRDFGVGTLTIFFLAEHLTSVPRHTLSVSLSCGCRTFYFKRVCVPMTKKVFSDAVTKSVLPIKWHLLLVWDERFSPLLYENIYMKMQFLINLYVIICIYVEWYFYTFLSYAKLWCVENLSVKVEFVSEIISCVFHGWHYFFFILLYGSQAVLCHILYFLNVRFIDLKFSELLILFEVYEYLLVYQKTVVHNSSS